MLMYKHFLYFSKNKIRNKQMVLPGTVHFLAGPLIVLKASALLLYKFGHTLFARFISKADQVDAVSKVADVNNCFRCSGYRT